jgi:uncharacterized protein (TIGR03790 family)
VVWFALTRRSVRAAAGWAIWIALAAGPVWGALDRSQVLILVNKDTGISARVAAMYQKLRAIPDENVLRLSMGTERFLTPQQYWSKAGGPIRKYLEEHPAIRCILTTSGVPYVVGSNATEEDAAFDNELTAVLAEDPSARKMRQPNPLFVGGTNLYAVTDPRLLKMVFVARLDGPDLATITRMVEDAVAVEKTGLAGPVFGDAQGIDGIGGAGLGDFSIRAAVDRFSAAGFLSKLDMQPESWKQPKEGVGRQAEGAAFYEGWYDLLRFQDIFGEQGLARGSIAWHIASQEAQDIWNPKGTGWCVSLMRRGVAVTLGPVREPYVTAFPHGDIFVEGLLSGLTVAESYGLALPEVTWAMVLLGDPLYRPFAAKPRPALLARAYVAENPKHVLEHGQTSALLVRIDCVGPPGSATRPFIAKTEPEMGLAAASGPVTIPPLKAGESAVVRIPRVTAANDSTGMFRLHLDVQDDSEPALRIVVEGRTGFSRLTSGLVSKTQMFVSPAGDALISGLPGSTMHIDVATLQTKGINAPPGIAVSSAEFSPEGGHIALSLYDPRQKKGEVVIADAALTRTQTLPAAAQFVRWLDKDRMLLQTPADLVSHSLSGGAERAFDTPAGRFATVIPGTDILLLSPENGKIGFRQGTGPFREVLQGIKLAGSAAVANDLTLFGGVDTEKRLWIQRGADQPAEVVATGVERVLWGPISHRALVEGPDRKSRVYDVRDRSWIDLGTVVTAAWSPDEERLLFVESYGSSGALLSLLTGRTVTQLCDMRKVGTVAKIAFSDKPDRAFLLAAMDGQFNVFLVALP